MWIALRRIRPQCHSHSCSSFWHFHLSRAWSQSPVNTLHLEIHSAPLGRIWANVLSAGAHTPHSNISRNWGQYNVICCESALSAPPSWRNIRYRTALWRVKHGLMYVEPGCTASERKIIIPSLMPFWCSVFKHTLKELSVLLINNRDSEQGPEDALFTRALSLVSDSVIKNVHMLGGGRTEPERKKRER